MGWELRKGKPYYYQKERQGNKVVSRYIGAGPLAPLIAEITQLDRERRKHQRTEVQIVRNELAELATDAPELTLLLADARSAVEQALQAAGYHQHKRGEWRKQRAKKET